MLSEDDPDEVMRRCYALLDKNPDDHLALLLMGAIYCKAGRYGLAVNVFKRVCELSPRAESFSHLGLAYMGLKHPQSRMALEKAWSLKQNATNAANMACLTLNEQDYKGALKWAQKALDMAPDNASAHTSCGMANLALGHWAEGWKGYAYSLGGQFRKETQYQDEPRWDGSPGKTLIVYGEQGLGDEIMYASCVPDACEQNEVILECDPRLEGLFKRSFPKATVYGTRRLEADWLDRHQLDARCAIGELPRFYRNKREDFPGKPYLIADPERRIQWEALLESFGKNRKKIGLAWSGGSRHNNPEARAIGLEALRPLIESVDATYVSLQYKDPSAEIDKTGLPVRHWQRINGSDYDETAALVAELDLVIGVHTSVHHLAGALGVPQIILVPDKTLWLYANEFPWYPAKLVRQGGDWSKAIQKVLNDPSVRGL